MRKHILYVAMCLFSVLGYAQLTVTGSQTAQQLAENLAGPNINVFNATLTGSPLQSGTFGFSGSGLDIPSGVILSSGNVFDAVGPNNDQGTSTGFAGPGTPETDALTGTFTQDAVVLEFDFEVQSTSIEFDYIFASEEYLEFVNAGVNDGFGFFISGPGITGQENLAVIPTTTTPVTIDNINNNNHWQFYEDNANGSTNLEFDGFTTVLKAKKDNLIPCSIYTLKLIIADASDDIYDSGVFLEENSLVQGLVSAIGNTINNDSVALEGCTDASFTFLLDSARTEDMVITYQIGGTAVNGVDYVTIDTALVIPAGQLSATIVVDALADGIPETQETVELTYRATPCSPQETVILYIDDAQPIDFTLSGTDALCYEDASGTIDAAVTGGFSPYQITLNGADTFTSLPITGLPAGTYQVEIDDIYGCAGEAQVVGDLYDAGQTFLPDGNGNVFTTSIPIGGLPGTLTDVNQIQSVCLNMEHSYLGDIEMKLIAPNGQEIILKERPGGNRTNLGEPVAKGPVDGANSDTTAGVGYDYCFTNSPTYGTMVSERNNYNYTYVDNTGRTLTDNYLPSGSYQPFEGFNNLLGTPLTGNWTIWVQDHKPQDNGYIFNWSISFIVDRGNGDEIVIAEPDPINISGGVTSAACGASDGAIDISASGTFTPLSFSWSNGATTEDISGLTAGSYTVTVTDQNSCSRDTTFLVSNASPLALSGSTINASCKGSVDGSINLSVSGGSGNYGYTWSNSASSQDISNLAAGTYTVAVNDQTSGCVSLETFTITEPQTLTASGIVTNESCGNREGAVALTINGGTSPYTVSWSNGASGATATDLQQGSYTATITDTKGCFISKTFQIINLVGNCIPDCDLTIDNESVTNETCGQANGGIAIGFSSTHSPVDIAWSNGSTSATLSTLSAGTYSVMLTDDQNCSVEKSYTITNNSGTLAISSAAVTNEACGNNSGGVNISVAGGSTPYSYLWSNGATTQDLTNVAAGTYSVTVTDNSGCSVTGNYTINNSTGSLQQTFGFAVNEVCGNSNGSIDITITGGFGSYNYNWSNGAITQDLTGLSAGTYSCTITDGAGCSITTPTYTVNNEAGTLALNFIDVDDETCGNSSGAINLIVSGGNAPYSYAWSNGATSAGLSGLSAGTYSCTISDASGCSVSTGNISVANSSADLAITNAFVQPETCGDGSGSIDLEISGSATPFSYSWSTGGTLQDITGLSAGTYTCTVTDTNNCTVSSTSTVQNSPGTLSVDNTIVTNDSCSTAGGAIDLVTSGASGNIYFNWSNGATTEDITGLLPGTYSCVVSDDAGCTTTTSEVITGSAPVLASINVSDEICNNNRGEIDIEVGGGSGSYTYQWSNGSTQQDVEFLNSGTYTCVITDAASGCTISAMGTVSNSSANMSVTGTVSNDNCGNLNGSITLNVSGGTPNYTYAWSNGATTQNLSGLSAGSYTVTVTDLFGCSDTETFTVQSTTTGVNLDNVAATDEFCGDGSGAIDLTISGGSGNYSYSWDNGATTQDLTGLSAGTYVVTITDLNDGCAIVETVQISNNTGSFTSSAITLPELCGNSDGSINLTVSGGSGNYSYSWSNGASSQDLSNLSAGTYTCTITDLNSGCIITVSEVVDDQNSVMAIFPLFIQNDICSQGQGAVFTDVGGGVAPYTYSWSNGWNQQFLQFVTAGTYTLTVTDANGCTAVDSFTVQNDLLFDISDTVITDATCDVCADGAIDLTVDNLGFGVVQYNWSTGAITQDITNLLPGTYTVEVLVDDGFFLCSETQTYVVGNDSTTNPSSVLSAVEAGISVYPNPGDGVFSVKTEGSDIEAAQITDLQGREIQSLSLSNGLNTVDVSHLPDGTYLLVIERSQGRSVTRLVITK